MDWALFAVQWLHVFFGIFWFGTVLYSDFILVPALNTLPLDRQREFGSALGRRIVRVIPVVAGLTILLGIIRGIFFSGINSLDALTTTYGLTWLVALVAAIATYLWGDRVIRPDIERLVAMPDAAATGAEASGTVGLSALTDRIKRNSMLELLGFLVIFTCMILMRLGY
jgi:uncharacterized membrane protein